MELFDVYDKNRNNLGYTKMRGETLLDNEYNVGVEIWIINDNKLLMTQRSINKSHSGKWEVPGGCSLTNETSIDTIKRELKEEVGITIKDYILLDTSIYKKQFVDIYTSNELINMNDIHLQESEVSAIEFITKKDFLGKARNHEIVDSVFQRYEIIKDKIGW